MLASGRTNPFGGAAAVALACAIAAAGFGVIVAAQDANRPSEANLNKLTPAESKDGWTLLFDGSTMTGWSSNGTADWKVEDGALTFTTGRGMLVTTKQYSDFHLTADFWAAENANSGVFIRCAAGGSSCYEINIFDPHATAPTGSIILLQPGQPPTPAHSTLSEHPHYAGKWNTYDITAEGDHIVIKINGKTMSDIREDKLHLTAGFIQLQAGGPDGPGIAKFRNIKLRAL